MVKGGEGYGGWKGEARRDSELFGMIPFGVRAPLVSRDWAKR